MSFKSRTLMFRAALLLSITAATTLPAVAGPVLNRLLDSDAISSVTPQESGQARPSANAFAESGESLAPLVAARLPSLSTLAPRPLVATPATSTLGQRMREQASGVVSTALNFLGMPYRHGGTSESTGFDCSGFTRYMFEMSVGLVLPRLADQQAKAPGLATVQRGELQPGDLVFFNTLRRTFSHVGIYIGDGKFIHAPKPGAEVRVEDMGISYWAQRFTGGRRADPDVDPMDGQGVASAASIGASPMQASAALPGVASRFATARHKPVRHSVRRHR